MVVDRDSLLREVDPSPFGGNGGTFPFRPYTYVDPMAPRLFPFLKLKWLVNFVRSKMQ